MPVSLIAAVAKNSVIGAAGKLPWRLPEDLARFKRLTMGHPVVMGRRTFESLERPLSGRRNIVLSRDTGFSPPGCDVAHTREEVITIAGHEELFVIGGASVFELFLTVASRMYITHIEANFSGDTFFPTVLWKQWRIVAEMTGERTPGAPPYRFVDYERVC